MPYRDILCCTSVLDTHPCLTISVPEQFHHGTKLAVRFVNGHLCLWDNSEDSPATVFPIPPKGSQKTITRDWSSRSSHSDPDAHTFDVFMDPVQNLIVVAYAIAADHLWSGNESGNHPQAHVAF
ncbi:hypothetical protein BDR05DRAFT_969461 [Suillus weaverae]|nr:hypothetical protein BDR05DRAFT_969461 [Suillus weaverae]